MTRRILSIYIYYMIQTPYKTSFALESFHLSRCWFSSPSRKIIQFIHSHMNFFYSRKTLRCNDCKPSSLFFKNLSPLHFRPSGFKSINLFGVSSILKVHLALLSRSPASTKTQETFLSEVWGTRVMFSLRCSWDSDNAQTVGYIMVWCMKSMTPRPRRLVNFSLWLVGHLTSLASVASLCERTRFSHFSNFTDFFYCSFSKNRPRCYSFSYHHKWITTTLTK